MGFVLENLPQNLEKFATYPGLLERLELAVLNVPILIGLVTIGLVSFFIVNDRYKIRFVKICASCLILLPLLIRLFWDYAYDTPFALVSQVTDTLIIIYLCYQVGCYLKCTDASLRISVGISIFAIIGLLSIILRINSLISIPFVLSHIVFTIWLIFQLWKTNFNFKYLKNLEIWLIVGITVLPFLPFLFSPAPPDADIITQSELIGYLYQGQPLWHVQTGVSEEWFSIRYPAGFAALGWIFSHFINIRASEIMVILSIIAYLLIIVNLLRLAKELNINKYLVLIYTLNPTITEILGIKGGQVQEMISYSLGISTITFLLRKQFNLASLCLAAAFIIHPVVALPFSGVLVIWMVFYSTNKIDVENNWPGFVMLTATFFYLGSLQIGEKLYESVPVIMLTSITPKVFFDLAYMHLQTANFGLHFFIFSLLGAFFLYKKDSHKYVLILVWLAGAFIIDGIFGVGVSSPAHANFGTIAIWILAIGLSYELVKFYLPKNKKVEIILAGIFGLTWVTFVAPGLNYLPVSVFTSHSDVRMGRFIENSLDHDVLLANIRPPGDIGKRHGMGFMMRGLSSRNTIFARIGPHQVKNGRIRDVDFDTCINASAEPYFSCLEKLGVTHVVVDSRPGTQTFVAPLTQKPMKQFGQTYLFSLINR
ncbi:MAG: hypothetical protein CMM60_00365 [Rhodospirillaceae bacterium]|nr:hypothetical protein [Rhodospirillaceae bacterium]MDP6425724.1 hypothetical protein [Dehalococcoidia bacterium]